MSKETPIMRANEAESLAGGLTASNPLDALLPEDRLAELARMPTDKRHAFYGRVMASVFSDPGYQKMVFDIANREFAQVSGGAAAPSSDLKGVVEEVVASVLKARGIG